MWCGRNTSAARWWAVGLIVLGAMWGAGRAVGEVQPVRPSDALNSYRLAEQWVRAGAVPADGVDAQVVGGLLGVRVTLRVAGQPFGEGTAWRDDLAGALGEANGRPIDLVTLLRPAVNQAFAEIEEALRDRNFEVKLQAAKNQQVTKIGDVPTLAEVGHVFDVDVQLARHAQRIVIANDAPEGEVYWRYAQGYHGLIGVADAGGPPAAVWPGNAVAENLQPNRQIIRLLHRLGLPPLKPEPLGRPGGVGLYRFEVLHVARTPGNEAPILLIRGHDRPGERLFGEMQVSRMTREVAGHLEKRFIQGAQVRGTYLPSLDRFEPALADRNGGALCAYALLRYARQQKELGMPAVLLEDMEELAVAVVQKMLKQMSGDDAVVDPSVVALCLMAIHQAPQNTFEPEVAEQWAGTLGNLVLEDGQIIVGDNKALPQTQASVVAAALADHYKHQGDPKASALTGPLVRLLDQLWQQNEGKLNAYALPWIAIAHDKANAGLAEAGLLNQEVWDKRAGYLAQSLDVLALRQIVEAPGLGPLDVLGGIEFRLTPDGSPPQPDWHTAQALCFIATGMRDPQLVPDRMGMLITAGGASRFLFQLMVDAPHTFALRNPEFAHGGIRLSLSDNRIAPAPTALTLIALLELRDTFAFLQQPAKSE